MHTNRADTRQQAKFSSNYRLVPRVIAALSLHLSRLSLDMAFSLLNLLSIIFSPSHIAGFFIGALLLRWVYLRFTAISVADLPGPDPESFWLGKCHIYDL